MKTAKEKQLLRLLLSVCKGTRVGPDLELAEVAARHEARLRAELESIERKDAQETEPAAA